MADPTTTDTRLEAEAEGHALVVSVYAHNLFMTVELTALDGRQLAADLIAAAAYLEAQGHVED